MLLHMGQSVAYGTLLNSCSCIQHTCFETKFFYLILQLGETYSIMGKESHYSTLLHKLTGSRVAYGTHMPYPSL